MTPRIAPAKEFFKYHFMDAQTWTTTADCVDYRLVRDGDTLLIVFQQSQGLDNYNGLKDWIRNIRAFPMWSYGFKAFIHHGFLDGFRGLEKEIWEETLINIFDHGIKKIDFASYSQGVGPCLLAYADLLLTRQVDYDGALYGIEINPPICFAPPRLTWCLFSWNMRPLLKDARLIRTRKDIVPHLPPAWWGYRHIGKVEYLEEPAGYEHPAHIPEWMCFTYHYPEYYVACLPSEREIQA